MGTARFVAVATNLAVILPGQQVLESQEADRLHRALPEGLSVGDRDVRGLLAKNGPKYLRWALIEAAKHAARDPSYRER